MSEDASDISPTDIAIVGMGLRVPGARTHREFWSNLRGGVESIRSLTNEELIAAGESPDKLRRKNYVARTSELQGLELFDADFFGFSPKEAAIMDPQHRQFLECAWEALEDATRPPTSIAGPVGVFAGCGMGSYFYFNVCSHQSLIDQVGMFLLRHTGNDKDFLSTRVSYLFDLHGPSVNVQTACSTSLVAVHYACQSLLNGECEMALAGGVTIELPHRRGYLYQDGEILSPDGHCRAFDHRAAGTVFGSGAGVVVLRRLADAIADGDPIRAVIKATAINNDGASKAGYLAPSVTGQSEAIVEAQTLAGVTADSIHYVECHGTGTYLGDPIEVEALTQAFRHTTDKRNYCRIGSVKSNIGHLDTAAGVVSLIKATLALENAEIPPTLGFEKPNPSINFATSPFVVADKLTAWPKTDGPRRAAVNSLGVGGTNAHAILEQAPARQTSSSAGDAAGPHVIALSAKSKKGLDDAGRRLADFLKATPEVALQDIAYSLANGRKHFEHRRVLAVADRASAIDVLVPAEGRHATPSHSVVDGTSGAVFLFPGGGAQYPGMARALYRDEPDFRKTVDEGLSYLPADVASEIRDLWLQPDTPDAAKRFLKPSLQLPAILIVEVAVARLWIKRGITPKALIGHSMGENTAACIAGVLSFDRAVNLVFLRGSLFNEIPPGGMLSVPLTHEALLQRLPAELDLASVNAPELCVVSGSNEALDRFRDALAADGIDASRIPIDIAAHSRMLAPILERFEAFLKTIPLSAPKIPIVSNLTGTWLSDEQARDPHYWVTHLRSTVLFAKGMAVLAEDKSRIYIEAGPGRVMTSLAKAQGSIPANQVINSLPHADDTGDDRLHFLMALGRAWGAGLPISVTDLVGSGGKRVSLPTYPFQHQPYFLERSLAGLAANAEPQFQKRADIATWGWQPSWRQSVPGMRLGAERTAANWLVFLDDSGTCDKLVMRLRGQGHRVVTVALGDAFAMTDEDAYVLCPEHGREGYDALLGHLASSGGVPERIVHAWLLTVDEAFRPGSSFFDRNQERGFFSLFYLAQALANVGATSPAQMTVLTNGMQRLGEEALLYPEKATVLGPAQVIPREMPGVNVRVIDLPAVPPGRPKSLRKQGLQAVGRMARNALGEEGPRDIADHVWEDLFAEAGNEVVAYRDGRRWSRDWEPVTLDKAAEGTAKFRQRGVYLITGGLGELATACAMDLAQRYQARLVLIGRAELPDRAQWSGYLAAYGGKDRIGKAIAAIQRIEQAGGEVFYARADITNSDALRKAVAQAKEKFGAINGVLHAAGVVKDDLIELKSASDIADVFAPKLLGTMVLDEVLSGENLDVMVLFSSTSTDTAPAGQSDYVAANAYLNAFAESRAGRSDTQVVALHWGIWNDVGLAARAIRSAEGGESTITIETARQPLFDRRVNDPEKGERLEARWDTESQWLLSEHRLKTGHAIWPGTGYIEVVAQALREFGVTGGFEIEDLTFVRPLYVPDADARTVRVTMTREDRSYAIAIESEVETPKGPGLLQHAEASARVLRAKAPARIDVNATIERCAAKSLKADEAPALKSIQDSHLRFGPRWQVLREIHFGRGETIARLALDDAFARDIEDGVLVHPALLDIATGYAMELIPGYDASAGLWVPMSYGRMRVYKTLPAAVWSHVRINDAGNLGPGYATFDITITDDLGNVVIEIERFTVSQLGRGLDFVAALSNVSDARVEAKASVAAADLPPALARLAAQVEQGITPEEGFEAMVRAIGTGLPQVIVSSMDLAVLQAAAGKTEAVQEAGASFERPDLGNEFVEPRNDVERTIAGFWTELLGIQKIGINDSFFDIGGHSLIAVRLFRMIKKAYSVDFPISVLFEAPTIAQCAELIERAGAKTTSSEATAPGAAAPANDQPHFTHLVRMHSGKMPDKAPFFVCAGMFGNILNLRHLAVQVGRDRPVYGIQARGLYGDQEPHETFEEMAADYIKEIRAVQPNGPYLIGGFSGGGLVAYEMAQQLLAAGEEVAQVIMLDTPYPANVHLSAKDKVSLKLQDFKREGVGMLTTWLRNRVEWELQKYRKRKGMPARSAEQFHNESIESAFYRALRRYSATPYPGQVLMLRPRLKVTYTLGDGRMLNQDRELVRADNGWTPFVQNLAIVEVPGNHDSMVLEPNVRVTCTHMREALNRAEWSEPGRMAAE